MVTIHNLEHCLVYLNRLGFGIPRKYRYPGWILYAQYRLWTVEERLFQAAECYPFTAHYHRKEKAFTVNGKHVDVSDQI